MDRKTKIIIGVAGGVVVLVGGFAAFGGPIYKSAAAAMIMPGIQKPHCGTASAMKAASSALLPSVRRTVVVSYLNPAPDVAAVSKGVRCADFVAPFAAGEIDIGNARCGQTYPRRRGRARRPPGPR